MTRPRGWRGGPLGAQGCPDSPGERTQAVDGVRLSTRLVSARGADTSDGTAMPGEPDDSPRRFVVLVAGDPQEVLACHLYPVQERHSVADPPSQPLRDQRERAVTEVHDRGQRVRRQEHHTHGRFTQAGEDRVPRNVDVIVSQPQSGPFPVPDASLNVVDYRR